MDLPERVDQQLVDKIIDFLAKSKHKVIVRIDGGVNSQVAAVLLEKALGENALSLIIDFGTTQTNNLIMISNHLKLNAYCLNRAAAYQKEVASYKFHAKNLENFYKRFVNYHLLIQAQTMGAKILDSFDKSDRLLSARPEGFYGHLMPFYSLYKSELFNLANFLNIPDEFIISSSYLNMPWDKIDPILYLLTEKQLSPEQISQQLNIDLPFLKELKRITDNHILQTPVSQLII